MLQFHYGVALARIPIWGALKPSNKMKPSGTLDVTSPAPHQTQRLLSRTLHLLKVYSTPLNDLMEISEYDVFEM